MMLVCAVLWLAAVSRMMAVLVEVLAPLVGAWLATVAWAAVRAWWRG